MNMGVCGCARRERHDFGNTVTETIKLYSNEPSHSAHE